MRLFLATVVLTIVANLVSVAVADEFTVYSVYRGVDFGNPGEVPGKDYYVNMGSAQGLAEGGVLEVYRRMPSYDVLNQKLYKDVTFPIARLKIIHVEKNAAITRLDRIYPGDKTPEYSPHAVIVGDLVRPL